MKVQGVLSLVSACVLLGAIKTGESQAVSTPLYLANYASSYNSHVVNHDVRYPIATAPIVAAQTPLVASTLLPSTLSAPLSLPQTPLVASRFATVPQLLPSTFPAAPLSLPQTPLVASRLASVPQLLPSTLPAAPLSLPQTPLVASRLASVPAAPLTLPQTTVVASPLAPVTQSRLVGPSGVPSSQQAPVEASARSTVQKEAPAPEQLRRSTQAAGESTPIKTNPVPNSVLAASQFLARQFSQQQGENSAEAPQNKPRFLVAGNAPQAGEKLNGDDSESVEVSSAESLETSGAPKSPLPVGVAPRARIVYSPVSVLKSPVVPSPYTQLISF